MPCRPWQILIRRGASSWICPSANPAWECGGGAVTSCAWVEQPRLARASSICGVDMMVACSIDGTLLGVAVCRLAKVDLAPAIPNGCAGCFQTSGGVPRLLFAFIDRLGLPPHLTGRGRSITKCCKTRCCTRRALLRCCCARQRRRISSECLPQSVLVCSGTSTRSDLLAGRVTVSGRTSSADCLPHTAEGDEVDRSSGGQVCADVACSSLG